VFLYLLAKIKRIACGALGHRPGLPIVRGRARVAECRRCLESVVLPQLPDSSALNDARRAAARAWMEETPDVFPVYKSANVEDGLALIEIASSDLER
jgi:hypothetical protein